MKARFLKYQMMCLCSLVLLAGCKQKVEEKSSAQQQDPNIVTVGPGLANNLKVGTAQIADLKGTLQVAAHVETDARRIARVGSPVAGRILRLIVFEGQKVNAGATLATLHSTELSDAQMQLIKAESQQGLAAAGVARAEQLVAADVIGRAELERRRAEQLQAATEVAAYGTQLRGLGMTEGQIHQLETNRRLSADYPIVSPRSGTVLKRDVTVGQVVQPADPAFTIADLSSVWIVANVPEEEGAALQQGLEVTVRIPASPTDEIHGRLSYVSPIVDPNTRTIAVRMDVANTGGALKPDQLASMSFVGKSQRQLTVPNTAVVREEDKDHVFVRIGKGRYILREVVLGVEENDRRAVVSGITEADSLVLDGAFHLNNQRKQAAIKGGE
ncbi:efflux RND transporter periplasmic adaptor subunit [Terriglobus sp. TAA 43]|uniref:efflux RND transporter periplasmic adaptor subunit n=1 Tax=Terriglobus sp. TAA 43 TaxID=278961 RepID=UPI000645DF2B|nr:efflux RND transporter periplasmic adaptor subunit [Terriglobus sp. TAA 43]